MQIPTASQPVVEQINSRWAFTRTWYLFFQQLLALVLPTGIAAAAVTIGASPFSYVAADEGHLIVRCGTVSLIEIGRDGAFTNIGVTAGPVPLSQGDTARVTYTVAPTLIWLPH